MTFLSPFSAPPREPIEGLDLHHQQAIFDTESAHLTVRQLRRPASPVRPEERLSVAKARLEGSLSSPLIAAPIALALVWLLAVT